MEKNKNRLTVELLTSIGTAMKIEWLIARKSNKQQLLLMSAALNCSESWYQNSVKRKKERENIIRFERMKMEKGKSGNCFRH